MIFCATERPAIFATTPPAVAAPAVEATAAAGTVEAVIIAV
ncbi:MAG: hypothetical protein SPJ31_01480 [Oscillospiraceae bacterium]|nr:hypothetical protein [Oscillospiraceae bacterium]